MLSITIPEQEFWDDRKQEFVSVKEQTIRLEHSLVSLSKWESKWHKPFLSKQGMTTEETIDYIKCMTLTQNVPNNVYYALTQENVEEVTKYIQNPMTATTFGPSHSNKRNTEIITSEVIYYWMIALNIPFECQKWHLNRLLTLIQVCNIKNQPAKKMSKSALMARNKALNDARRKQFHTKG